MTAPTLVTLACGLIAAAVCALTWAVCGRPAPRARHGSGGGVAR